MWLDSCTWTLPPVNTIKIHTIFNILGSQALVLTANGQEIPFKLLTLKYPKDADGKIDPANDTELDFDEAYNTLFSGTGKIYSNAGLDITREDYPGGMLYTPLI